MIFFKSILPDSHHSIISQTIMETEKVEKIDARVDPIESIRKISQMSLKAYPSTKEDIEETKDLLYSYIETMSHMDNNDPISIKYRQIRHLMALEYSFRGTNGLTLVESSKDLTEKIQTTENYQKRVRFTYTIGWSIPSKQSVEIIAKFIRGEKILEVGAGSGMWAKLLSLEDIDIVATDDYTWDSKFRYYDVEKMSYVESIEKYRDREVLMLSWPNYQSEMAFESLKLFQGKYFIYIGEKRNLSCGTPKFFDELDSNWNQLFKIRIPRWTFIMDRIVIYRKN